MWCGQTVPWKPSSDQTAQILDCLCPINSACFLHTPQRPISLTVYTFLPCACSITCMQAHPSTFLLFQGPHLCLPHPEIPSYFPQEEEWFTQRMNYRRITYACPVQPAPLFSGTCKFSEAVFLYSPRMCHQQGRAIPPVLGGQPSSSTACDPVNNDQPISLDALAISTNPAFYHSSSWFFFFSISHASDLFGTSTCIASRVIYRVFYNSQNFVKSFTQLLSFNLLSKPMR